MPGQYIRAQEPFAPTTNFPTQDKRDAVDMGGRNTVICQFNVLATGTGTLQMQSAAVLEETSSNPSAQPSP